MALKISHHFGNLGLNKLREAASNVVAMLPDGRADRLPDRLRIVIGKRNLGPQCLLLFVSEWGSRLPVLGLVLEVEFFEGEQEGLSRFRVRVEVESAMLRVKSLGCPVAAARIGALGCINFALKIREVSFGVIVDGIVDDAFHSHAERVLNTVRNIVVEARSHKHG